MVMGLGLGLVGLSVVGLTAQLVWLATRVGAGAVPDDAAARRAVRWGVYVNPDDPRGWLPKPSGVGWTVNFRAWPQAYGFFALIGAAMLGAALLVYAALTLPG